MKTKKIERPGDLIYRQMREADLTVRDLAFLLGKSYHVVYYALRGRNDRPITLEFAQKCAVIFNADPSLYLEIQVEQDLLKNPLDPSFKKLLPKKYKELVAMKQVGNNKRRAGRKWTL